MTYRLRFNPYNRLQSTGTPVAIFGGSHAPGLVDGPGIGQAKNYLIDAKPIPIMGYKRSKGRSHFRQSADYGYCAGQKLSYFGYKLVMITTLEGIPVVYDIVPANTDSGCGSGELFPALQL